jgi:hypothetical protein
VTRAGPALSRTSDVDLGSGAALDSPSTALWRIVGSMSSTQGEELRARDRAASGCDYSAAPRAYR